MRELAFLHQNADRWKQFEQSLNRKEPVDPDELAALFVQVLDDLSYAETFYPHANTTSYLQGLAAKAHGQIYANKKEDRGRILHFWKEELPRIVAGAHKEMAIALAVFIVAIFIGFVSSKYDSGFVRMIMGDQYVNMTLENIQNDDPMAVYKQQSPVDMFLAITVNNIYVSFIAFAFGAFFSLGTGFVLFRNGVMIGAFHHLFYEKDLLIDTMLVIFIHGTLELSVIVIAGGAGFVLGNGILFPGTYRRLDSFITHARNGAKIIIGLIPIFVVAGFLEGFVTRHTQMPVVLSLSIILISLGTIVWYFILYPLRKKREPFYEPQ